jgi:hypothetical protein
MAPLTEDVFPGGGRGSNGSRGRGWGWGWDRRRFHHPPKLVEIRNKKVRSPLRVNIAAADVVGRSWKARRRADGIAGGGGRIHAPHGRGSILVAFGFHFGADRSSACVNACMLPGRNDNAIPASHSSDSGAQAVFSSGGR